MSVLAAVTFVLRGYFSLTVDKSVCVGERESAIKREKHTVFARTCLSSGVCVCVCVCAHAPCRCACVCAPVCVCVPEPARVSVWVVSIPPCCRPLSPGCCLPSPPLGPPPCPSCLATPRPDTAYAAAVTMETDMMSAPAHRGLWGCKVVASLLTRITTSTYPPCPEDPPHLFSTCPPINGFIWRPATPSCMVIGHPPCRPL